MAKKKVLKLTFTGGGITRHHASYFSRYDNVSIAAVADDYGHMINIEPSFIPETDIWETKIRGVIDHMLDNGPNLAPAGDGLVVQQILDGIYRSARTGREVTVR